MTEELQQIAAHRKLRLVVDTNLFISSLLSPRGSERALIEACFAGKFELLYCEHLLQEVEDVISRAKFRKRFTVEEGLSLIDAIILVGTEVPDRAEQKLPRICDDPDDNFLFALYEDGNGDLLVSGDKKVLKAAASALWITSADGKMAATLLEDRKAWGSELLRGDSESGWEAIEAAGNRAIFNAANFLFEVVEGIKSKKFDRELLAQAVVPGTATAWLEDFESAQSLLMNRAFGTHPIIISPEIVAIKLIPDLGDSYVALRPTAPIENTVFLTLERCPDLLDNKGNDALGLDGWRAHSIGPRFLQPNEVRPPTDAVRKKAVQSLRGSRN
ncbi:putative toxin-antitoxin system toxin component, PIN family [Corynebacterium striatum]